MMKIFIFFLAILLASTNAHAATEGDEAPESDIGLAAESAPDDTGSGIPEVTFTLVDDAPVIDGELFEDSESSASNLQRTIVMAAL